MGSSSNFAKPSLTSRVEALLAQAKKLDACLEANGISFPSFEEDTLDCLPEELQIERHSLTNASNELTTLLRGAQWSVLDTCYAVST